MKEKNINVGIVGYAENHEMEGKEAISFIPMPGGAENKKAFKQRTLNKLIRLWIHYALMCLKSIILRTFLLSHRQYQVPIYHHGCILCKDTDGVFIGWLWNLILCSHPCGRISVGRNIRPSIYRVKALCDQCYSLPVGSLNLQIPNVQWTICLLKPTGHVMHQQFNIQQLYVLPTLYLCVLYLSENKQRLVPLTS